MEKEDALLENVIPVHKMGFKILKEVQLKNLFPTYENLFQKIDVHRKSISRIKVDMYELDYQYNLMYDNIFSIFGTRGSGKTSTVFTLKKSIKEKYRKYGDYVFPVIMPEMIPDGCDIISWILAIIEEKVAKLEKEINEKDQQRKDKDYFQNCRFKKDNRLRSEYNHIKELYFSKGYDVKREESFEAAIGNNEAQTQYSYEFSRALTMFWTTLKEAIIKANGESPDMEPMIYIIFDDVDLAPNKVVEMLSIIIKYLSHPNLIIIVTADEELFSEVVENSLKKKLGYDTRDIKYEFSSGPRYLNKYDNYLLGNAIEKKNHLKKTARLYLSKILPPSSRYYLNTFDTCLKRRDFIENIENQEGIQRSVNLEAFLNDHINDYLEFRKRRPENRYDNFLYYNGKKENFILIYLLFWGNTSRQLANECFLIDELFSQLKKTGAQYDTDHDRENLRRNIYHQIYHFLYNTINSNGNADLDADEITDLVENIWYMEHEQWFLYVNYNYLNQYYEMKKDELEMDSVKHWDNMIRLLLGTFSLLYFVENILYIWDSGEDCIVAGFKRERIHGSKNLVDFLDTITKNGYSLAKNSKEAGIDRILYLYGWLMEKPDLLMEFNIGDYSLVKDYFYVVKMKEYGHKTIHMKQMLDWSKKNPKWFATMVKLTHLAFDHLYLFGSRDMYSFYIGREMNSVDSYIKLKQYASYRIVQDFLTHENWSSDSIGLQAVFKKLNQYLSFEELKNKLKNFGISGDQVTRQEHSDKSAMYLVYEYMENALTDIVRQSDDDMEAGEKNSLPKSALFLLYLMAQHDFGPNFSKQWDKENQYHSVLSVIEWLNMRLTEYYGKFTRYHVFDPESFLEGTNKLYFLEMDTKELERIRTGSSNALDKKSVEKIRRWVQTEGMLENLDNWSFDSEDILSGWKTIMESIEIEINAENMDNAKMFIAFWESLQFLQKYYIRLHLEQKAMGEHSESFEDMKYNLEKEAGPEEEPDKKERSETFCYLFYKKAKEIMEGKRDDSITDMEKGYLASLIADQIETAGLEYYVQLMEKGENRL